MAPPPPRITPAIERIIAERVAAALAAQASGSGTNTPPVAPLAAQRACTYKDFMSCKPTNFKGTEGVTGLLRWFEKMESVFRISNCPDDSKVKFSTCTLLDNALTWWNAQAQALGEELAYEMNWGDFKQLMTDNYCPRTEIQKLETEFWNLQVTGDHLEAYNNRFLELSVLCPGFVTPEYKKIERYIGGLPERIQGNVTSANPTEIRAAIQLAVKLNNQYIRGKAAQSSAAKTPDNKRKFEDNNNYNDRSNNGNNRNNHNNNNNSNNNYKDNQQNKRQDVGKAFNINNSGKTRYAGNKPQCNECNQHHTGVCDPACGRCQRHGHHAENCRTILQQGTNRDCYGCGETGHFRKDCPKLNMMMVEVPAYEDENK